MSSPETCVKGESAGILFQALRRAGVEPDLAYRADNEVRNRAGENVISAIAAKMDAQTEVLGARIDAQRVELNAKIDANMKELSARTEKVDARIDDLRVVVLRVIWPLIILLAVPIFGELYRTLSAQ